MAYKRKKKPYTRNNSAAFYAGVGYGKASNGETNFGFISDDDKRSFERGTEQHNKYFVIHSKKRKKKGFFARIFPWL